MKRVLGMLGLVVALALVGSHEAKAETPHGKVTMVDASLHGSVVMLDVVAPAAGFDVVAAMNGVGSVDVVKTGGTGYVTLGAVEVAPDPCLPGHASFTQLMHDSHALMSQSNRRLSMLASLPANSESSSNIQPKRIRGVAWPSPAARIVKHADRHV